jgi:hypothetical protein
MSVTFTFGHMVSDPQFGEVMMHGLDCDHVCTEGGEGGVPCPEAFEFGLRACEHAEAAQIACGCQQFDVNVSNTNAVMILQRLGLEVDFDEGELCGNADPDDILGRAMLGNVGRDDSGTRSTEERGAGGATFVDCGLRAGYFGDRLGAIAELATEAKRLGMVVAWA